MSKQPPKQKHFAFPILLWHCVLLVFSVAFISCHNQAPQQTKNDDAKEPQPIISINKDSSAPPKVTYITAANQPRTFRASKPIFKRDSTNGGTPFFVNYGKEKGLPTNFINKSIVDKAGNLWFGTQRGACRYDGKTFTIFNKSNGMPSDYVWSIMQDNVGNLWFGTLTGGVSKYDGKVFTNYSKSQGLPSQAIECIFQDKAGSIWFGTYSGACKYDGKTFINYTIANNKWGNFIDCIMQDKKGNFWFGTRSGVIMYNGKEYINYNSLMGIKATDEEVQSIIQDTNGDIWFCTWGDGVVKYDGKKFTKYTTGQGLVDNNVRCAIQDRSGTLWFGTNNGVSSYDRKKFTSYTTSKGLADNSVRSILEDKDGDLWFGTLGGGVSQLKSKGLTYYSSSQYLTNFAALKMIKDKNGSIWIDAERGPTEYNGQDFITITSDKEWTGKFIFDILQDREGHLWLGTTEGELYKYDGRNFTKYSVAQGLTKCFISNMLQDSKGNLWICSSNGAFKFDGASFTNYNTSQGLADSSVNSIIQDKNGDLWFGTEKGASKYDGKNFTNYTTANGLISDTVEHIMQDRSGNIWFGTDESGVSKYDGNSFTNYSTSSGLADNHIEAIIEDTTRNIIWLATDEGLSGLKLNPTINSITEGAAFENFNINTGYAISGVNWKSLCLDNNGVLWMGCEDNKIMKFDYALKNNNDKPLNLAIQSIRVNNENICWNNLLQKPLTKKTTDSLALLNEMATTFEKVLSPYILDSLRNKFEGIKFDSITRFNPVPVNLVLPYKDNNLSIDFVAIEPSLPKQVKYQYKLEGYDKDWSPPGNNTTAVFGNIPEGSYTFKLKALSPYGVWSETEYKFKVLPPWYRTWWAYALYILLFIATIWSFIYYRSKQLRRENRILEEKVGHRTKQLKQSLENLKATQSQLIQSEKMASLGELTAGIAHEIQNPLNFVNNFSEVNTELIDELSREAEKGNIEELKAIASDIKENEQKINHHGKRADAIVKGMLQHSRSGTGVKEPTDINKLADEYLRLAYHGLRAKDNSYNATIKTDFDESIGKINIIPQDIGRVLLNLYNNAFYAVNEKFKANGVGYEPTISVSTKKSGNQVSISVKDNGNGIPQKAIDKIFQPFFTTKPTGSGTGLGLSLSYDIVKAHGGEIKVETKEGEGTEFIICLPIV